MTATHSPQQTSEVRKLGLALSGGGFRASYFHLGVLACLAENDILRHVDVLSCVSGGSIVGARYYLGLKYLLETKACDSICREDYIEVVAQVCGDFHVAVQRNIRASALNVPFGTLSPSVSIADRLGELYEKEIFLRAPGLWDSRNLSLSSLKINPFVTRASTDVTSVQSATAKPVELILNATCMNTGRLWCFTCEWMGPPPFDYSLGGIRLRRVRYSEAPGPYREISLGMAVAASSCVPGLFEPVTFRQLYPDVTLRLLSQDCNFIIVSDAGKSLQFRADPGAKIISTAFRSSEIAMQHLRDERLVGRVGMLPPDQMLGIALSSQQEITLDYLGSPQPHVVPSFPEVKQPIPFFIRRHLEEIRTDLDAFSDTEAFSLMTAGYRIAQEKLVHGREFDRPLRPAAVNWPFLRAEPLFIARNQPGRRLRWLLRIGRFRFLRVCLLSRTAILISLLLITAVLLLLAQKVWVSWEQPVVTYGGILTLAALLLGFGVIANFLELVAVRERPRAFLNRALIIFLLVLGRLVSSVYRFVVDPLWLRAGRL
jgi:hypothetical protein